MPEPAPDERPAPRPDREAPIPVPRFVAWAGRHGMAIFLGTLLLVALLEGVAALRLFRD